MQGQDHVEIFHRQQIFGAGLHPATRGWPLALAAIPVLARAEVVASFGTATLSLSPIIARFAARHPALDLRVDYDDRARDLLRDGFDVAIRISELRDNALIKQTLRR